MALIPGSAFLDQARWWWGAKICAKKELKTPPNDEIREVTRAACPGRENPGFVLHLCVAVGHRTATGLWMPGRPHCCVGGGWRLETRFVVYGRHMWKNASACTSKQRLYLASCSHSIVGRWGHSSSSGVCTLIGCSDVLIRTANHCAVHRLPRGTHHFYLRCRKTIVRGIRKWFLYAAVDHSGSDVTSSLWPPGAPILADRYCTHSTTAQRTAWIIRFSKALSKMHFLVLRKPPS